MIDSRYNASFYEDVHRRAISSAGSIVPVIMELISPRSVVDVGCGVGSWLSVFKAHGVERILGIDSTAVESNCFVIDPCEFRSIDLAGDFVIEEQFDLAVCLEVGEHLPASSATRLVKQLTCSAPVVLFSAALPGQGGTAHVNEQWHTYWHGKFATNGYSCFDVVRPRIIHDERIATWYRQNTFLYADNSSAIADSLRLHLTPCALEFVTPHVMSQFTSVRSLIKSLHQAVWRGIRNRLISK